MNKIKKKPPLMKVNPFFRKLVITLTIYICSFYFTKVEFYPEILKIVTVLILMNTSLIKAIKQIWTPTDDSKESLITFMILSTLLIGKFDDAVLSSFIYQIFLYFSSSNSNVKEEKKRVLLQSNKTFRHMPVEKATIGTNLRVNKNEKILVDGILKIPKAYFKDESGNRFSKKQGETIYSGWISNTDNVLLEVTKTYQETKYYQKRKHLNNLKEQSSTKEENLNTRIHIFQKTSTIILSIAIFIFLFLLDEVNTTGIYHSIILLVLINTNEIVKFYNNTTEKAIEILGSNQIIFTKKDKIFLLPKIKNYIFEKTGTLTVGNFRITEVETDNEEELFYYLNYGEHFSNHPIAEAIRAYQKQEVEEKKIKNYEYTPNFGISYQIDKKKVLIGNSYFMKDNKIDFDKNLGVGTIIYVAVDKNCIGSLVISDAIKYKTKDAILELKAKKAKYLSIVSSDNERIVSAIARELQIKDHYSNLTDDEKKFWISHVKENHPGLFALVGRIDTKRELCENVDLSIILSQTAKSITTKGDLYLLENDLTKLITAINITTYYNKKLTYIEIISWLLESIMIILTIFGYFPLCALLLIRGIIKRIGDKKEEQEND